VSDNVEDLNNGAREDRCMATMNFSVPDEVRAAFNKAFAGANKSALMTQLMREAVEGRRREQRRARAIARLLELRRRLRPVSERAVARARGSQRP
jgi:hypothetical protein